MPSRKIRLKLYADENFPLTSIKFLKSLGISVVHAYSLENIQKSDLYHLKVCKTMKRILITLDRDFGYNWTTLKNHPGVILVRSGNLTPASINTVCQKAFKRLTPHFVSESLVRITTDKIWRNKNGKIDKLDI